MNITDTMAGRDLEALRAAIAGQVFVPGQAGYDQARQGWNLAVDTACRRRGGRVGRRRGPGVLPGSGQQAHTVRSISVIGLGTRALPGVHQREQARARLAVPAGMMAPFPGSWPLMPQPAARMAGTPRCRGSAPEAVACDQAAARRASAGAWIRSVITQPA